MKNLDWIRNEPDEIRKGLIEKSPWYTMEPGTEVYVNFVYDKPCHVVVDNRIFTSERICVSERRVFEGVNGYTNTSPYHRYSMNIKQYLEECCPDIDICDFIFSDDIKNRSTLGLTFSYVDGEHDEYEFLGLPKFNKDGKNYDVVNIHLQWMLNYHELAYCRRLLVDPLIGNTDELRVFSFEPKYKIANNLHI